MEILMTIAVLRFMLPDKDIKLCGGKEKNLRQLLPLGIIAGTNSLTGVSGINQFARRFWSNNGSLRHIFL